MIHSIQRQGYLKLETSVLALYYGAKCHKEHNEPLVMNLLNSLNSLTVPVEGKILELSSMKFHTAKQKYVT